MTQTDLDHLTQAVHKAQALKLVLDSEFDALKQQDLGAFETLQAQKLEILHFLASDELLEKIKAHTNDQDKAAATVVIWDQVVSLMSECRDLHRRNEILINHKLETIRGALNTIQSPDPLNSVEIYDRLGKMRPSRNRSSVGDA
ncbi:flagellar protein FlgN [Porticoccaceae bacterium]|jgi:flagellar biosynthesis/type III secretory pathway chaperone|nr:flagellar protein FlgN [Porticoccaceae bacterium]MDG1495076.1 flagellar export chaperone FlgN [Porticoccaceae bacterium]|tara:strand:- start:51 stop:482 length:432 start_codon:yes stop_codon:yes gene_type:complete